MRGDLTIDIDVVDSEGRILAYVHGTVTGDGPVVEVTYQRSPLDVIQENYEKIHTTESFVQQVVQQWVEQIRKTA